MKQIPLSGKIFKISATLGVIVVAGKFIGFARDAIIAAFYGATWQTDAFFLAQSLPGVIFPAVCNSVSTAFLSIYVSKIVADEEAADKYASKILMVTAIGTVVLSFLAILFLPILIPLLAPGFNADQTHLSIYLSRIVLATFVLGMAHYMFAAILSSKKLFYGAQIAALGYNFTVIALIFVFGKNQSMATLTWSVVLGHVIQVVMLYFIASKRFHFYRPEKIFDKDAVLLLQLAFPILIGNSMVQINNIVDRILASLVGSGAVSALTYSNTLNRFVTGVIMTMLSTVLYPYFAESYTKNNLAEFCKNLKQSTILLTMAMLPISIVTVIFAKDVVQIVYKRGHFGQEAFVMTSILLACYGGMYIFSSLHEMIARAFYAMKDTKTPLKITSVAILANSVISIILTRFIGIGGIALGTTLSAVLAVLLLLRVLRKRLPMLDLKDTLPTLGKMSVAGILVIVIGYVGHLYLLGWNPFIRFGIATAGVFSVYFALLCLFRCKEASYMLAIVKRKLSKLF